VPCGTSETCVAEIETLLALIDQIRQLPEADEDKSYEVNAMMAMQAM
jgi:hypothetical protein